jgi:hypothetical protein
VALDVPKPHYANDGRASFDNAEVRILLEREGEVGILTYSHKGRGCVQALRGTPKRVNKAMPW